jgi:hypothetical protein
MISNGDGILIGVHFSTQKINRASRADGPPMYFPCIPASRPKIVNVISLPSHFLGEILNSKKHCNE